MSKFTITAGELETILDDEATTRRSSISPPPGQGRVHGLFWYERVSTLYAMRDYITIDFTSGSEEPLPGDTVVVTGLTTDPTVIDVVLESGTWAGGDAAGKITLKTHDVPYPSGSGGVDIDNNRTGTTNVMTLAGTHSTTAPARSADHAGLVVSSATGWSQVDLGYEIAFDGGQNEPDTLRRVSLTTNRAGETPSNTTDPTSPGTMAEDGTDWTNEANAATDDANFAQATVAASGDVTALLKATNFGFNLPPDSEVVGVKVTVKKARDAVKTGELQDATVRLLYNGELVGDNKADQIANWNTSAPTTQTSTYGSATDKWGAEITRAIVNDATFGVAFAAKTRASEANDRDANVYFIGITVYYLPAIGKIYFHDAVDATDLASGDLIHLFKRTGDWTTNDAEGIFTVYNIDDGAGDFYPIPAGVQVRDAQNGGGNLIATTNGRIMPTTLPSSSDLDTEGSFVLSVLANFYARKEYESVFGVTGASPAFMWDGNYFVYIRTGLTQDLEKPRHIAKHQSRLALGYRGGTVQFSVTGEPLNFDGSSGAFEQGVGDTVTGLLALGGNALAVFCVRSIHTIIGSGNSAQLQTISPDSGALEYTVQDAGVPLYCDYRGISTISDTDRFGDFAAGRSTLPITPWLLPRLQGSVDTTLNADKVVGSVVVRRKNQYRVFFSDGYVLTMTLWEGAPPQHTFQQYYLNGNRDEYIRVGAWANGVTLAGRDRAYIAANDPARSEHVYEIDRGNSFDGGAIDWHCEIHINGADEDAANTGINFNRERRSSRVHVETDVLVRASTTWATGWDFERDLTQNPSRAIEMNESTDPAIVPARPWYEAEAWHGQGRHQLLRMEGSSSKQFPVVIQTLIIEDNDRSSKR